MNPEAKGRTVKSWIFGHKPVPQAEANVKNLNKMILRIKDSSDFKENAHRSIEGLQGTVKWNSSRPHEYSVLKWRRMQVQKFIDLNPDAKGKEVKLWMQKHDPVPWPEAGIRKLNNIVRNLRNQTKTKVFQWDYNKPEEYSLLQQRRKQIYNYIKKNPQSKGKAVKSWLQNLTPNPWPEATMNAIYLVIARFKSERLHSKNQKIFQDYSRPVECSVRKWRRIQLERYLIENPEAKGEQVKEQLQSHEKNPQPDANLRGLGMLAK